MSALLPGILSSHPTMEESRKRREVIRRHLLVFVYAERCQAGNLPYVNHSGIFRSESGSVYKHCTDLYCLSVRQLLQHVENCRNGRHCTFTNCATTKAIFGHWKSCVSQECPVCFPIKDIVHRPKQDEIVARAFATVNGVPSFPQAMPAPSAGQTALNLSTRPQQQLPPQFVAPLPGASSQPTLKQLRRRKLSSGQPPHQASSATSSSSLQAGPSQPTSFQIPVNIPMRTGKARRVLSDNLLRKVFGPLYEPDLKSVAIYYSIVVQIEAVEEAIFAATGQTKENYDKAIADHLPILRQQFHEQLKVLSESFDKVPDTAQPQSLPCSAMSSPASASSSVSQLQSDEFSRRSPVEYLDFLEKCTNTNDSIETNSNRTISQNSPVSAHSPLDLTNTAPGHFPLEQADLLQPDKLQTDKLPERPDPDMSEVPSLRIDDTVAQIEEAINRASPVRSPDTTSAESETLPGCSVDVPELVPVTSVQKSIREMMPLPSFPLHQENVALLREASESSGIPLERFCAAFTEENIRQAEKDVELMYRSLGSGSVIRSSVND